MTNSSKSTMCLISFRKETICDAFTQTGWKKFLVKILLVHPKFSQEVSAKSCWCSPTPSPIPPPPPPPEIKNLALDFWNLTLTIGHHQLPPPPLKIENLALDYWKLTLKIVRHQPPENGILANLDSASKVGNWVITNTPHPHHLVNLGF